MSFTGIDGVDGAAGLLRTKLQHHVQEIGVLFFAATRSMVGPGLEVLFADLAPAEQVVLRALATDRPLFGGTLDLYGVSSGAVGAARKRMIAKGMLTRDLGIVDPMLADWIRRTLPL